MSFCTATSFGQDPNRFQTWARRGHQPLIPTTAQRYTQRLLAQSVCIWLGSFTSMVMFEGLSYTAFLDELCPHPVQDLASFYRFRPLVGDWLDGDQSARRRLRWDKRQRQTIFRFQNHQFLRTVRGCALPIATM